ncbi:MAG: hypothetical protein KKA79_01885 [Nanoarchaeota archaeon]|nr:hypothetical protein [Nanoarchaeota archaeon]
MGEILLKDGVRYNLWTPENEPKEFEPMIIEHVKDIFGEGCEYFSKTKIETIPGISRIPDGFVTDFKNGKWYIVELKLLGDDAINRIGNQITDYKEINKKSQLKVISKSIKNQIENEKRKTLVSEIIFEKEPDIIVIINSLNGEKEVQFRKRAKEADKIIEFKTFEREDDSSVHVHLFEPVYIKIESPEKPDLGGKRRWSNEPGHYPESELKEKIISDLKSEKKIRKLLSAFVKCLLEKKHQPIKSKNLGDELFRLKVSPSRRKAGTYVSVISHYLTSRKRDYWRQVVEYAGGERHGAHKDDFKIREEYVKMMEEIAKECNII